MCGFSFVWGLYYSFQQPHEAVIIILSLIFLSPAKEAQREKMIGLGSNAGEWQGWDLNPGLLF